MDDKVKKEEEVLAETKEHETDSLKEQTNKIEKVEDAVESNLEDSSNDIVVAEVVETKSKAQPNNAGERTEREETMKDDPNAQPYHRGTEVKRTTSDDAGSIAMILGIIAIVCSVTGYLALVGLVLGIIALVKGSKIRKVSSSGLAGWVLGIISIVFSGVAILAIMAFLTHLIWLSPFLM